MNVSGGERFPALFAIGMGLAWLPFPEPDDWTETMGVTQAPEWLVPAFTRSAKAVGATADKEQLELVAEDLVRSWSSPDRQHHAIRHLMDVLAAVDQLAEETHNPDVVRLAAWYHGAEFRADARASYAHRGGEDPVAGGERASRELPGLGVPEACVTRISELAQKVQRHAAGNDVDAQALCDADLSGLAAEPQKYKEYRKNIRAEYSHIPVQDYLDARISILQKICARPRIFLSPMAQGWEEPARQNITAELCKLETERTALEAIDAESANIEAAQAAGEPKSSALTPTSTGIIPKVAPAPDSAAERRVRDVDLSPAFDGDDQSSSSLGRTPRY